MMTSRVMFSAVFCAAAALVVLQGSSVQALSLNCKSGTKPALMHIFIGKFAGDSGSGQYGDDAPGMYGFDDTIKPYSLEAGTALDEGFDLIVPVIEEETPLVNTAHSSPDDASPDGPYPVVHNAWGGFLLFKDTEEDVSAVEGLEIYWASQPHVDFGGVFVENLQLDSDGRGADTVQLTVCVDKAPGATGRYHTGVVVDLGDSTSSCDADTVLSMLTAIPAPDGAADPALCGTQWPDYSVLSFSEGIDGFDRNKRENVMDAGCLFNFDSESARDSFLDGLEHYISDIEALPCVLGAIAANFE